MLRRRVMLDGTSGKETSGAPSTNKSVTMRLRQLTKHMSNKS